MLLVRIEASARLVIVAADSVLLSSEFKARRIICDEKRNQSSRILKIEIHLV